MVSWGTKTCLSLSSLSRLSTNTYAHETHTLSRPRRVCHTVFYFFLFRVCSVWTGSEYTLHGLPSDSVLRAPETQAAMGSNFRSAYLTRKTSFTRTRGENSCHFVQEFSREDLGYSAAYPILSFLNSPPRYGTCDLRSLSRFFSFRDCCLAFCQD